MSGRTEPAEQLDLVHRPLPPIAEIGMATLALIVVGGVYLAAHIPHHVSLVPAVAVLVAADALLFLNFFLLARLKHFAFDRFFQVAKWMLLAYVVIAGMIAYAFIYDGTRGDVLAVLMAMLVTLAIDVPTILGFTVARYQRPGEVGRH